MKETPWGNSSKVDLSATLHTDVIPQQLHAFDSKAQFDKNNGIYQDGGISSLYEASTSVTYDKFVYLSNGKKVGLTGSGEVYIDDIKVSDDTTIQNKSITKVTVLNTRKYYYDVAILDDGSVIALYIRSTNYLYDVFDEATGEITATGVLFDLGSTKDIVCAAFVRAHSMTIASIISSTGIISIQRSTNSWYAYLTINGTSYKVTDCLPSITEQFDNLAAYYHRGTILACIANADSTADGTGLFVGTAHGTTTAWDNFTRNQYTSLDALNIGSFNLQSRYPESDVYDYIARWTAESVPEIPDNAAATTYVQGLSVSDTWAGWSAGNGAITVADGKLRFTSNGAGTGFISKIITYTSPKDVIMRISASEALTACDWRQSIGGTNYNTQFNVSTVSTLTNIIETQAGTVASIVIRFAGIDTIGDYVDISSLYIGTGLYDTKLKDITTSYDGTITAATPITGTYGKELSFNKVNSQVAVAPAYLNATEITFTCWARKRSYNQYQCLYSDYDPANKNLMIGYEANSGNMRFYCGSGITTLGLSLGGWTVGTLDHWAFVFKGSQYMKTYKNGVLLGTLDVGVPASIAAAPAGSGQWLGKYGSYYFDGEIYDARFYLRALSAAEVVRVRDGVSVSLDTMKIYCATSSLTTPVYTANVDTYGSVVLATAAGDSFPSIANFKMEKGYVYPAPNGCGGIYSTNGAAPFGSFIGHHYQANSTNVLPVLVPDNDFIGEANGFRPVTYKGQIAWYCSAIEINALPVPLTDVFDNIYSNDSYASTSTAGLWKCPFMRYKTGLLPDTTLYPSGTLYPADPNYKMALYNKDRLFYSFTTKENFKLANIQEIAPGVVNLGLCAGKDSILDTNTEIFYDNLSGVVFSLYTTYTNTSSLAYFQRKNLYSNSLDYGLMNFDYNGTIKSNENGTDNNIALYNGATGLYYKSLIDIVGQTTVDYYKDSNLADSTYSFNAYVSPSVSAEFQDFGIKMPSISAIQQPNYYGFQTENILQPSLKSFFNLQGTQYAYDGSKIYIISFQNGYASAINGIPQILCFANGLEYLCSSPDTAFFLSTWDNSIITFDGGRTTTELASFSNRSAIQSAVYNTRESALIMLTTDSVITMRKDKDEYITTENTLPYTETILNNTSDGVYFVSATYDESLIRTYFPLSNSVIIPLNVQTGWYGPQDNQTMIVTRIVGRVLCHSDIESDITVTWHWTTQDESGSDVYTISTTNRNTEGYFTFDLNPETSMVLGASVELEFDDTQKITLVELEWYYKLDADANIFNHAL